MKVDEVHPTIGVLQFTKNQIP